MLKIFMRIYNSKLSVFSLMKFVLLIKTIIIKIRNSYLYNTCLYNNRYNLFIVSYFEYLVNKLSQEVVTCIIQTSTE